MDNIFQHSKLVDSWEKDLVEFGFYYADDNDASLSTEVLRSLSLSLLSLLGGGIAIFVIEASRCLPQMQPLQS
jgi:hypothetical protein